MARTLEFFFDFMSPPTYLAFTQMQGLIARTDARVIYKPMVTISLLKLTGNRSPREVPAKAAWMARDLQRWARRYGVTLAGNRHIETLRIVPPLRGALVAMEMGRFDAYARAMFRGMFVEDLDIGEPVTFARLITEAGLDPEGIRAGIERPDIKARLHELTREAADRGAFGAPAFFVDGELFWGNDRLSFVEEALLSPS
jgi:2-hydroxychromene-2-carboxylate isomerase